MCRGGVGALRGAIGAFVAGAVGGGFAAFIAPTIVAAAPTWTCIKWTARQPVVRRVARWMWELFVAEALAWGARTLRRLFRRFWAWIDDLVFHREEPSQREVVTA